MDGAKWERVHLSIRTKVRKCPDCRALVEDNHTDRQAHMEAHYPPPELESYEYAPGGSVRPGAWRQVRDIFRLRPPREAQARPAWTAEQVPDPSPRAAQWGKFQDVIARVTAQGSDQESAEEG